MNTKKYFVRKERKYLLNNQQFVVMHDFITKKMDKDEYFVSHIYTLYFDTEDYDLVNASLMADDYKYKVRLRSYNDGADRLFFEIKSKLNGVTYKRRVQLTNDELQRYLGGEAIQPSDQVMKEIDHLYQKLDLSPKIFIAYDRLAYRDPNSDLRITFDTNLRSRNQDLDITNTDDCQQFFDDQTFIMEVKSKDGMSLWLTSFLTASQIFPNSFSKYGKIYTRNQQRSLSHA